MAESLHASPRRGDQFPPFYYGWINVLVAALAMSATLPGRTHGLGLITEPLLADLGIEATHYARINFWTSLLGAAFCLRIGWLIDRYGVRATFAVVTTALGASVLWMTTVSNSVSLFLALVLVRGFGQSALSIVSMAMIGKWFRRRLGIAMGLFAVLLTFGFIGGILGVGWAVEQFGWRDGWLMLAYSLLAIVPLGWLLVRNSPESLGVEPDEEPAPDDAPRADGSRDFTLSQALRTPAFWIILLGASAFNLVWSAITLFNESIMAGQGFDARMAVEMLAILTGVGLVANLVAGAVTTRRRIGMVLGTGLVILAVALGAFPWITTATQLRGYAVAMGATGGIVTVVFFAAWGHLFGRAHLGRIQGAAQLVTVLASATGPLLMAQCEALYQSHAPLFHLLAAVTGVLAIASFVTPLPNMVYSHDGETVDSPPSVPELQPVQE